MMKIDKRWIKRKLESIEVGGWDLHKSSIYLLSIIDRVRSNHYT